MWTKGRGKTRGQTGKGGQQSARQACAASGRACGEEEKAHDPLSLPGAALKYPSVLNDPAWTQNVATAGACECGVRRAQAEAAEGVSGNRSAASLHTRGAATRWIPMTSRNTAGSASSGKFIEAHGDQCP